MLPIIKHIPGHGRARVDSHKALPRVDDEPRDAGDRPISRRSARWPAMPWAMTAHIVYHGDRRRPRRRRCRAIVIDSVIRGEIGFDGVLVSDDISMGALAGSFAERTRRALDAGCDLVLHCNGDMAEMEEIAAAARPLTPAGAGARRARRGVAPKPARRISTARAAERRFAELMAGGRERRTRRSA